MIFDFEELAPADRYKLLSATVVPRPIALVTTRDAGGNDNAAPFSFFNVFSEDPPILILGLQRRPDGRVKDTTLNIRRSGEYVINLVDEPIAEAMIVCAAYFPPGESETAAAGLSLVASTKIEPARIADSPVSFECRRKLTVQLSAERDLVIGEVLAMHVRDGIIDPETLRLDWSNYHPVGRLFVDRYIRTGDVFNMEIPAYESVRDGLKDGEKT
jgi:flavin reductase (DIM6/NTAB) family NADH-FMN oxidoreductase RutF